MPPARGNLAQRGSAALPIGPRGVGGALSGALAALALPPFGLWPLLLVAFLPIVYALSNPGLDRRAAGLEGIAFGALFYGLLLHWVPFTLHGMIPSGALSGVLAIILLSGIAGIQGILLHTLLWHRQLAPVLALPVVWAGTEYLLAHAGPLAFPWTPLALAFATLPEVAAMAEIAGIQGVTLWVTAVNGVLAGVMIRRRMRVDAGTRVGLVPGPSRLSQLFLIALLLLPLGWGMVRVRTLPMHDLPEILLVQLEVPRDDLLDRDGRGAAVQSALARAIGAERALRDEGNRGLIAGPPPLFALLPEAPFGAPLDWIMERGLGMSSIALGAPLLVGTHLTESWEETGLPFAGPPEGWRLPEVDSQMGPPAVGSEVNPAGESSQMDAPERHLRNAVLFLAPGEPTRLLHTKSRLVPGVETGGLTAGPPGGVFEIDGLRNGILICFEASFPSEGRRLRREGAELLLNPSNDGWFAPSFGGVASAAHSQHQAHLILRAVESRVGAARSSLGGELLLIAPTGRVVVSGSAGDGGFEEVRPLSSAVETGFVRFGDLAGVGSVFLLLALLGWRREQRVPHPS